MNVEKSAVRQAFGKAAGTYDSVAQIQRTIAEQLLHHTPLSAKDFVLDAGCGTAYGARLLRNRQPDTHLFVLDAAQPMCAASQESRAICGDIEYLPLTVSCLDLYWSSLAWQWTRPELAAAEAFRSLKPGGNLRVATLGPETLCELRAAFSEVDSHPHVRDFDSPAILQSALSAAGFTDICIKQTRLQSFSADLRSLLQEIRSLGAHELGQSRRRGMLGRQSWQKLIQSYERFRCTAGLPASYDVLLISARKP